MRATLIHGERDIRVEDVPDPEILAPGDALVRVTATCVCGSDLWPYRGASPVKRPRRIGHEFVGVVEEVGSEVTSVRAGQFVIAPFVLSDGTCPLCVRGVNTSCVNVAGWGTKDAFGKIDGGQGQWIRVPMADGTLVGTDEVPDDALVPSLLTLSDVMGTGHHAAVSAGVTKGSTVVVVGDGAVGLCGVLASQRLGAERIVLMSRHQNRQNLGRRFGATHVVAERGAEGVAAVKEILDGIGADATLECVGTGASMQQAFDVTRGGGMVGYVGMPHGVELPIGQMFGSNVGINGGVAPVRAYIPELLGEVLSGAIEPGLVFDGEYGLEQVAEAYAGMDERKVIKALVHPNG